MQRNTSSKMPPRPERTFDSEFEGLANDDGPSFAPFEEIEVVVDAADTRPESGLAAVPELRWLPYAGAGLAIVVGVALVFGGRGSHAQPMPEPSADVGVELSGTADTAPPSERLAGERPTTDHRPGPSDEARSEQVTLAATARAAVSAQPTKASHRPDATSPERAAPVAPSKRKAPDPAGASSEPASKPAAKRQSAPGHDAAERNAPAAESSTETPRSFGMLPPPPEDELDDAGAPARDEAPLEPSDETDETPESTSAEELDIDGQAPELPGSGAATEPAA